MLHDKTNEMRDSRAREKMPRGEKHMSILVLMVNGQYLRE